MGGGSGAAAPLSPLPSSRAVLPPSLPRCTLGILARDAVTVTVTVLTTVTVTVMVTATTTVTARLRVTGAVSLRPYGQSPGRCRCTGVSADSDAEPHGSG